MYEDTNRRRRQEHERHVALLARIVETRCGDDDSEATRFLNALVVQTQPRDKARAVKLAAAVEAWRRARRVYRYFFE
jgi:hypothetical protein